jgi:hypothetical protein
LEECFFDRFLRFPAAAPPLWLPFMVWIMLEIVVPDGCWLLLLELLPELLLKLPFEFALPDRCVDGISGTTSLLPSLPFWPGELKLLDDDDDEDEDDKTGEPGILLLGKSVIYWSKPTCSRRTRKSFNDHLRHTSRICEKKKEEKPQSGEGL